MPIIPKYPPKKLPACMEKTAWWMNISALEVCRFYEFLFLALKFLFFAIMIPFFGRTRLAALSGLIISLSSWWNLWFLNRKPKTNVWKYPRCNGGMMSWLWYQFHAHLWLVITSLNISSLFLSCILSFSSTIIESFEGCLCLPYFIKKFNSIYSILCVI